MHPESSGNSLPSQQQTAGDIDIPGNENATAFVNAAGNASINQSRNYIINYYYREATAISVAEARVAVDLPCPYRGLFHFGPNDAEFFFGREVFVAELVQAVQSRSFVPVLGASGSGKSSVVLAGLVPALQKTGHWKFTHFRPGEDPFHALALALTPLYTTNLDETDQIAQARKLANYLRSKDILLADVIARIQQNYPNHRVLLIADQFEELYTLCTEEVIRRSFLDCLLASLSEARLQSSSLILVATMRADFLGKALSYRPFADVLQAGDVKLGAMNREELCETIEKPAAKLGVTFEAGLAKRILEDVESEPGNLPLLEFALTELWEQRDGRHLTHAAYEGIGQVEGALARYADQQYARLSASEQEQVRRIFIQLVRPGEGTEDTRRLATKAELGEERWTLVTQLANSRLVVTSQDRVTQETVEVVHEALIRNWGELRKWMVADRSFRVWQDRLRGVMHQWEEMHHDESALLRGAALAEAEERLQKRQADLSPTEQRFIQESLTLQQRERQQRERSRNLTLLGLTSFSILALCFAAVAGWQWRTAKQEQIRAQTNFARASFTVNRDTLDALLAALKAGKQLQQSLSLRNDPELQAEVMEVLAETTNWVREYNRLEGHNNFVWAVSFSPDGQTIATSGWDNTLRLWNAEGKAISVLKDHTDAVTGVSFSRDGKFLATCSKDGSIKIRDARTGQVIKPLKGRTLKSDKEDTVWRVRFSPDGKTVAAVSEAGYITLWNWQTNDPTKIWQGHPRTAYDVDFSPDGQTIATAGGEGIIKLWTRQGQPKGRFLSEHTGAVTAVRFSPVGTTLASGSTDNTVILWNWQTQTKQKTLRGHSRGLNDVQFSSDGQQLATSGDDATIFIWDQNGTPITTLKRHQERVTSLSFSPDSQQLASASVDGTVKLWQLQTPIRVLKGYADAVYIVSIKQPDGQLVATDGESNSVKLWRLDGTPPLVWQESAPVYSIDFSPKAKMLAVTNGQHINLRDLQGNQIENPIAQHNGPVLGVSFSPDGQTIATSGADDLAKLWNLSGQFRGELKGHTKAVHSVRFSPDGQTIATASWDGTVKLWTPQGELKHSLQVSDKQVYRIGFSPDSRVIAAVGDSPSVKLWKLDGTPLTTLKGHTKAVMDVSFSTNGHLIATCSNDGTIKLWNRDGKLFMTLLRQDQPINALGFTPDDQWLIAGSGDKAVLLIDMSNLTLDGLMQRGCRELQHYKASEQFCNN